VYLQGASGAARRREFVGNGVGVGVGVVTGLAEHLAVVHLELVMALRLRDVVGVSGDRFDVVMPPFLIVSASICPSALCLPKCR